MTRQIKLKKKGNDLSERVDFLREVTAALLDEVKSLTPLKRVKIQEGIDFEEEIKSYEIQLIERALKQTNGNQVLAAHLLKLKHTTLNAKIKRYAIQIQKSDGGFTYG